MRTLCSCPLCSSPNLTLAFSAVSSRGQDNRIWSVSECSSCGHQFMNPQPSWQELSAYYNKSYSAYSSGHGAISNDAEELALARRTGLLRHIPIPTGKRLLD